MNAKSIFQSKLFWLGVINVVAGVLAWLAGQMESGIAITSNGLMIVFLRAITTQAVKLSK